MITDCWIIKVRIYVFDLDVEFLSVDYKKSIMDYVKMVLWNYDLEDNLWLDLSRIIFEDFSLGYIGLDCQVYDCYDVGRI